MENYMAPRRISSGMPPYSTDPALSRERYADPDYMNSSDPTTEFTSDQMSITFDAEHTADILPSSPPKHDAGAYGEDEDEPTDDDEAASPSASRPIYSGHNLTYRAVSENTIRPGSFVMAARKESSSKRTPDTVVAEVFDNELKSIINLENMGLEDVPLACKDLINHEDLGRRQGFQIDLSYNRITRISRFFYDFRRLEYLSLRFNNLTEVSPLICQLTELRELHLGNNELEMLPAELLRLPNCRTLTTYPNRFIPPPESGEVTKLVIVNPVPSLANLASRAVAKAGFVQDVQEFEKTLNHLILQSPKLHRLLAPIAESLHAGRVCSVCMTPIVEPLAYHLHWTRHGEDRSGETIPFQTMICSTACLHQFRACNQSPQGRHSPVRQSV